MKKFLSSVAQDQLSTPSSFQGDFVARTPEAEAPELTAYRLPLTAYRLLKEKACKLAFLFFLMVINPWLVNSQSASCQDNCSGTQILTQAHVTGTNVTLAPGCWEIPPNTTITVSPISLTFSIINCTIRIGANSTIRVAPNVTLIVDQSYLHPTNTVMWNSIRLPDPNSRLEMTNTCIEGMQYGVFVLDYYNTLKIENNIFVNNLRGLNIQPGTAWTNALATPYDVRIVGNSFTSNGTMSGLVFGQPDLDFPSSVTSVNRSYMHLFSKGILYPSATLNTWLGLVVGDGSAPAFQNRFENADFGFFGIDVTGWIQNAVYTNIGNAAPQYLTSLGYVQTAVQFYTTMLLGTSSYYSTSTRVGVASGNYPVIINDSRNGIRTNGNYLLVNVSSNQINNISDDGIRIDQTNQAIIHVDSNRITNAGNDQVDGSIKIVSCTNMKPFASPNSELKGNIISANILSPTYFKGRGIEVSSSSIGSTITWFEVEENTISGKQWGIRVLASSSYINVRRNTITLPNISLFPSSDVVYGIQLESTSQCFVGENVLNGIGSLPAMSIYTGNDSTLSISGHPEARQRGIEVYDGTNDKVNCNILDNISWAMDIRNGGNNSVDFTNGIMTNCNRGFVAFSKGNAVDEVSASFPCDHFWIGGWGTGRKAFSFNSPNALNTNKLFLRNPSSGFLLSDNGSSMILATSFINLSWINLPAVDYFTAYGGGGDPSFSVEENMNTFYTEQLNALRSYQDISELSNSGIYKYYDIQFNLALGSLNGTLSQDMLNVLSLDADLSPDALMDAQIYFAIQSGDLLGAKSLNENWNPTGFIASSKKTINTIWFESMTIPFYQIEQEQEDQLLTIANLCVQEYGKIVLSSRSLLEQLAGISFIEEDACNSSADFEGGKLSSVRTNQGVNDFIPFPNPCKETSILEINVQHAGILKILSIIDGSTITYIDDLKPGINSIQHNLSEGVYLIVFVSTRGDKTIKKLIVTK